MPDYTPHEIIDNWISRSAVSDAYDLSQLFSVRGKDNLSKLGLNGSLKTVRLTVLAAVAVNSNISI